MPSTTPQLSFPAHLPKPSPSLETLTSQSLTRIPPILPCLPPASESLLSCFLFPLLPHYLTLCDNLFVALFLFSTIIQWTLTFSIKLILMQKQNLLPPFSFLHLSLGAVKRVWGDQNISYLVITATPVLGEGGGGPQE